MEYKFFRKYSKNNKRIRFNPDLIGLSKREVSIIFTLALNDGFYTGTLSGLYKKGRNHPPKNVGGSTVQSMKKAILSLEEKGYLVSRNNGRRAYSIVLKNTDKDISVLRNHIEKIKKGNKRKVSRELVFKLYIYILSVQKSSGKGVNYIFQMSKIAYDFNVSVQTITKAKKALEDDWIIASQRVAIKKRNPVCDNCELDNSVECEECGIQINKPYVPQPIGQTLEPNAF